jgi:hypothetical protein
VLGHVANHRRPPRPDDALCVCASSIREGKARALELWADRLQGIVAGGAEVVEMRRKR